MFLKLTVPKWSFERRVDGIKGSSFSLLNLVAWSRWRGKEPCSSTLKGTQAQVQMLAVLPLTFARLVLCGQVEWKSLQRICFPCLLLTVCYKWLKKKWGKCEGDRSLISGCNHSHAGDLTGCWVLFLYAKKGNSRLSGQPLLFIVKDWAHHLETLISSNRLIAFMCHNLS